MPTIFKTLSSQVAVCIECKLVKAIILKDYTGTNFGQDLKLLRRIKCVYACTRMLERADTNTSFGSNLSALAPNLL